MGKSVIVVAPEVHLGGLTSGGLGWTDSGQKAAVGGLAREYYRRVKAHYDKPENWKQQKAEEYRLYHQGDDAIWAFEPHIAEKVFEELVTEFKIPVVRNEWLDRAKGVTKEGTKIVAFRTLSGKTYRGKVFLDATYEGDLMAAAGVSFTVGREANAKYGETMNGVQTRRASAISSRTRSTPTSSPATRRAARSPDPRGFPGGRRRSGQPDPGLLLPDVPRPTTTRTGSRSRSRAGTTRNSMSCSAVISGPAGAGSSRSSTPSPTTRPTRTTTAGFRPTTSA